MDILWMDAAIEDMARLKRYDTALHQRAKRIVEGIVQDHFGDLAKPEPLKGNRSGWWSRRLTQEHRIVYRVSGKSPDQILEIASVLGHY